MGHQAANSRRPALHAEGQRLVSRIGEKHAPEVHFSAVAEDLDAGPVQQDVQTEPSLGGCQGRGAAKRAERLLGRVMDHLLAPKGRFHLRGPARLQVQLDEHQVVPDFRQGIFARRQRPVAFDEQRAGVARHGPRRAALENLIHSDVAPGG